MSEKLKSFIADDAFFMAILLVLIAIISFGLGRYSLTSQPTSQPAGVMFSDAEVERVVSTSSASVIGSRAGTKYHLLTCPGASQIKESNKIFFNTISDAKAAGYTPAANCSDLQ